jgi:hypothetical protein
MTNTNSWNKYFKLLFIFPLLPFLFLIVVNFYFEFTTIDRTSMKLDNEGAHVNEQHKKYNIGIVSFLGNVGDSEQAVYRCLAAAKKDWRCYSFFYHYNTETSPFYYSFISKVQDVINYFFKPDFIIHPIPSRSYKRNKNIPAYLVINYDIMEAFTNPENDGRYTNYEVLKNITEYDGFILYNLDDKWFQKFHKTAQSRLREKISDLYIPNQHSSVYLLDYHTKDFKKITYTGHNWDKLRSSQHYQDIFELLGKSGNFEAYGPPSGWAFASSNYYKGFLPHDGQSVLKTLDQNGISLIFHSDLHLAKSIYSSNRLFEAATVSNLIISDAHPFIKKEFGDCVFFVNPQLKPEVVAQEINRILTWAKENPQEALKKTKCAHDIFAKKFSLEEQMEKIIEMHEKFLAQKNQQLPTNYN